MKYFDIITTNKVKTDLHALRTAAKQSKCMHIFYENNVCHKCGIDGNF